MRFFSFFLFFLPFLHFPAQFLLPAQFDMAFSLKEKEKREKKKKKRLKKKGWISEKFKSEEGGERERTFEISAIVRPTRGIKSMYMLVAAAVV